MSLETDVRIRTEYSNGQGPIPMVFLTDFGNDISDLECMIAMERVARALGYEYKPPHKGKDIEGFDIVDGASQLRQAVITRERNLDHLDLPTGVNEGPAVFGIVVDPGVGTDRRIVVVETASGNKFVGPDNGVLSLALQREEVTSAYAIKDDIYQSVAATFHGRDLIAPTMARLAGREDPSEISYLERIDHSTLKKLDITENTVVHVDGYGGKQGDPNYGGNVKFEGQGIPEQGGERATAVKLTLPKTVWRRGVPRRSVVVPVGRTFDDVRPGQFVLITGSSGETSDTGDGQRELAVRMGKGRDSAAGRLDLYPGDNVGFDWIFPNGNGAQNGTHRRPRLRRGGRARK